MATELLDDFGSDAEEYEDALEELQAEELDAAAIVKDATIAGIEKDAAAAVTSAAGSSKDAVEESVDNSKAGRDANIDNIEEKTTENSETLTTEAAKEDMKETSTPVAKHSRNARKSGGGDYDEEEEEEEEEEDGNRSDATKVYCDIPADPSEKTEDPDTLHERLNEQMDDEEDEVDDEVEKVEDIYIVDEEAMKELEKNMTDEEKLAKKDESQALKAEGNEQFKAGEYLTAMDTYTKALKTCPLCFAKERAIMYSNRGACRFKRDLFDACAGDCTRALELHPAYVKALLRRADCHERTEKLEQALEDYTQLLQIDPSLGQAREACMRLPDQIKEKNEKLKEEMMGKLKDLGNMVLRPFGLSTNNFNLVQNPDSGSYSVNFNNNGS